MTTATTSTAWLRVSKRKPCLICGRPDWCLVSSDDTAAICARTAEGATRQAGAAGWLHRLSDSSWTPAATRSRTIAIATSADLGALAQQYRSAISTAALSRFAASLGVSTTSLERLRIGWDGSAWCLPMVDAHDRVIGIRRRLPNGKKLSVRGGREGLFIPTGLGVIDRLLIAEGPTDTAALLDLGFHAIGRPSCTGGTRLITELVRTATPALVVVVADADEPGQRGAAALASTLRVYVPVKVITPEARDARAWLIAGASHDAVVEAIEAAPAQRLVVRSKAI